VLARVFLRRLAIAGRAERDALARRPSRLVTAGS
jgi:hypothetical protein